ncbi:MAG: hypothetical protein RMJ97_00840 [Raineya sp.]|nr:hypothetical protein [Raineya sp.]MDW8295406.1 hypothetical protein [Raineya sp.]
MENLVKAHKCPTILFGGIDTLVQNQAYSEALVVAIRPDLDDNFMTSAEEGDSDKELHQEQLCFV